MKSWPELRQPLLVGLVLVYLAVKLNQRLIHWPVPLLVSSYVADVTALPIMLSLVVTAQRRLGSTSKTLVLPDSWLVAAWAYVSLVFEGLLPCLTTHAVADPWDVVAYALGTWLFRRWLNRPKRR